MQAKYDARNASALKQLVAGGAKLFRFPTDFMEAAFKEAQGLFQPAAPPAAPAAKTPARKRARTARTAPVRA
jgi:TRAP-type mannitol/chloroaromatic compound transport system substrate-binding protein